MELLYALLDLADAVSTAIGILVVWYTWVAPRRGNMPPQRQSDPDELEHFLRSASLDRASRDTST